MSHKLWDYLLIEDSEKWIGEVHRAFRNFFEDKLDIKNNYERLKGK